MFAGSGDDDSFFLHHVLLGFGLFLPGSSVSSVGFGFLDPFFFGCFFLTCFSSKIGFSGVKANVSFFLAKWN
jgi:hypothetical protein